MTNELTTARVAALLANATPGPWGACKDGECTCGIIWSKTADHPVANLQTTTWGDEWFEPVDGTDAVVRRFHEYGRFPQSQFHGNAALIAAAPALAAAYIAQAARIEALEQALNLAANRLHRCSVDYDTGSLRFYETGEWADEARAVIKRAGQ